MRIVDQKVFYFSLVAIFIIIGILFLNVFILAARPTSQNENWQEFEVKPGWGMKEIGQTLKEGNLITSLLRFKFYTVLTGRALSLKPGNYLFSPSMTLGEIVKKLWQGSQEEVAVTIPEGFSLKDIDRLLSGAGIIISGKLYAFSPNELAQEFSFLSGARSLEGYLFPDTYRFFRNSGAKVAAQKMIKNFQLKVLPSIESSQSDLRKIVILASLIEKEVILDSDRYLVAGILKKRLESDFPLQVDATVVYIKCKGEYQNCPTKELSKNDFRLDSPFNTYLYQGLPPSPIANPGLSAIKAALKPLVSEYWFYLSDPVTKKTLFSKSLEEHNFNRSRYLKIN